MVHRVIQEILQDKNKIPMLVFFKNIQEIEKIEDRFFEVERVYGDIVGMNVDSVEFCPNNTPPLKEEILPWLWLIHPECKNEILIYANTTLKKIISEI